MNAKIIFSGVLCLFLLLSNSFNLFPADKKVMLDKISNIPGGLKSGTRVSADDFVTCYLNTTTLALDLEFFDSADDLNIEIYDNYGNPIFVETVDTTDGLHIIVDLSQAEGWFFEIYMYNDDIDIYGELEL